MSLIFVLSVQAAAVATPAPLAPPPASGPGWAMPALTGADGNPAPFAFDLARYRSQDGGGCAGGGGDTDVLVCGPQRRGGAYPMDHWARIFGPEPRLRAEMGLGGNLTGQAYVDAVPMDRGLVSHRVMVGIKLPF